MIKFFRSIRQNLLTDGKTTRYIAYAIGEILLVVIGILIALSINNWNEQQKSNKAEIRYINDLIKDLKNDSIMLDGIDDYLRIKSRSKEKLTPVILGEVDQLDSMSFYFERQWSVTRKFTPTTITIEELKNSGNLNVIRDVALRREIVALYNGYSDEEFSEDMFIQQNRLLLSLAGKYFRNLLEPQYEEIHTALKDNEFVNAIIANFTFARRKAINELQDQCFSLIKKLEDYQKVIE